MLTEFKKIRMERGLRQFDVALRTGVSESKLSKIETGRIVPDPDLVGKIAAVLDVAPEELQPIRALS